MPNLVDYKMHLLKLEEIVPKKGYAFTVNPAEQYFGDLDRMDKVINLMKAKLRSPRFEYDLYIEVSPKGRIHAHGYIWIYNPLEFTIFDIPYMDKFMNIDIDTIENEDVWSSYITKQCHIVKKKISRFLPKQSELLVPTNIDQYYDIILAE